MLLSKFKQRLLNLLLIIAIAIIWVLLNATPAIAQESAVNYTYSEIRGQDFSHRNLAGGVFAAADARGASFEGSDVSNSILTEGNFINTNLKDSNFTNSLMDRVLMQAIAKVLGQKFNHTFSVFSYGYMPGRSVQQAARIT